MYIYIYIHLNDQNMYIYTCGVEEDACVPRSISTCAPTYILHIIYIHNMHVYIYVYIYIEHQGEGHCQAVLVARVRPLAHILKSQYPSSFTG